METDTHTQIYAETLAGKTRETFGYVMPTALSAKGHKGHITQRGGQLCGGGGPSRWESWPSPGKPGVGRQGRGEAQKPHRPRTASLHRDRRGLTYLLLLVGTHAVPMTTPM